MCLSFRLLRHRATLAELEALQRGGDLVRVSEVKAEPFTLARAVRDALPLSSVTAANASSDAFAPLAYQAQRP